MTNMRSAAAFCVLLAASAASAQYSAGGIKLGLLTDMNGVYSAISGAGSLKAAEMAADVFMKANKDFAGKVTVIAVDHQNKADIASNKASEMFDRLEVDAIFDTVNSACALATASVAQQKKKIFIDTGVLMYAAGTTHPLRKPSLRILELVDVAKRPAEPERDLDALRRDPQRDDVGAVGNL